MTKASHNYRNESWDLVDALKSSKIKLEEVKDEDLPEQLRDMSVEERKAHVQAKAKERTDIQQKIQQLNGQRQAYIAAEMERLQGKTDTLGSAIIQAVREQAVSKNFEFQMPEQEKADNSETPKDTQ